MNYEVDGSKIIFPWCRFYVKNIMLLLVIKSAFYFLII